MPSPPTASADVTRHARPSATSPAHAPTARDRRRERIGLLLLFLVALGLRLAPMEHGDGANYLADTHVVRSALGMAKDKDLVPPVGKYSTYPNLLPYTLLPIYGVQYAAGRAAGAWSGAGEYGYALLERPALAHYPARVLVALLGALTALVVWRLAREGGLGVGAWAAGWLVAVGLLHLHFSVQERPWAPLVLFVALAALFAGRHVRTGGGRALVASGLCAGLAFATHQAGLVALAVPGLAWLLAPWRGPLAPAVRARVFSGVRAVVAFAVVALVLGHPYLIVHGATSTEQVAAGEALAEMEGARLSVGGQGLFLAFSTATFERLSKALVGYDPVLVALALAGLVSALARPALRPALLFALGWGAFFMFHYNDHVRYLLPLVTMLPLAAGAAVEFAWSRPLARAFVVLLLVLPLVQAARLVHVLRQPDTRTEFVASLEAAPPEGVLAIDVHGPEVPLDRASLERLAQWRPLGARERHRLLLYEAGLEPSGPAGRSALPIDALYEFEIRRRASWPARHAADALAALGPGPTEALLALGVREVLLVDRSPADAIPSALVDEGPSDGGLPKLPALRTNPTPLAVFDPSRGARANSARLPTEMDFALTDLWQVAQPGPYLERRRLAR